MTDQQKKKLVSIAETVLGKPYHYGAKPEEAPETFDCSSFTQYLFKQIGIELPRSTILQAGDPQGREIVPEQNFENLEIGDLLFMRGARGYYNDVLFPSRAVYIGHVGVYVGNGELFHASSANGGVVKQKLSEVTRKPHYEVVLVKRF